jgi:hypothetical protein
MTVTDYYDSQSLLLLGSTTTINDYDDSNPSLYFNITFIRQLVDINYVGRPPGVGDSGNSNTPTYSLWTDPMLWVAVGVVAAIAFGIGITIYITRKRARLWDLVEIEKFETKAAEAADSPESRSST